MITTERPPLDIYTITICIRMLGRMRCDFFHFKEALATFAIVQAEFEIEDGFS